AFLVNEEETVEVKGTNLARGVFVKNSEVGDGALWFTLFLYDAVCSNHIVWNAQQVEKVRVRHMKSRYLESGNTLYNAVSGWRDTLRALPEMSTLATQIKAARDMVVGDDESETVETIYKWAKGRNLAKLTQTVLTDAYATAEKSPRYGSPRSVWGM